MIRNSSVFMVLFSALICSNMLSGSTCLAQAIVVNGSPTGVWVNNGEDKVTKDELRLYDGKPTANSVWDGKVIKLFAAQNEVVSCNIVIESARSESRGLNVVVSDLASQNGKSIKYNVRNSGDVFNFPKKDIELFFVKYLKIVGLSLLAYEPTYDERHVPFKLRLPFSGNGKSSGLFTQRPNANKYYPDIAVPLETMDSFSIPKGENQSIWVDIYTARKLPPGEYRGAINIIEMGKVICKIPLELTVYNFVLPDTTTTKTMVWINEADINERYTGVRYGDSKAATPEVKALMDDVWRKHHLLAQRHRISLINDGIELLFKQGMARWEPIFNGSLFSPANNYAGPGEHTPGNVYCIGTYGAWKGVKQWGDKDPLAFNAAADKYVEYFSKNFPQVDYFLYLWDEPKKENFGRVEELAKMTKANPGSGKILKTFCTTSVMNQVKFMPSVDIVLDSWGDKDEVKQALKEYGKSHKQIFACNGWRPASGTMMIEDDGVAMRVNPWIQYKHNIDRWYVWAATNYKNPSRTNYNIRMFSEAMTFGRKSDKYHDKYGETGTNYGNGDGVLFYPGIDVIFPEENHSIKGPIASLRLKHWRRGIQDVEYIALAAKYDKEAVEKIINKMIPKALWEVGVTDKRDPTYVHADISWSIDPDVWEAARRELVSIIVKN